MSINSFTKSHIVEYHELNTKEHIREYELGNLVQQAAAEHADLLKRGYNDLKKLGKAWMMSRVCYSFYSLPKASDKIFIETWVDNFDRLYSHRDCHICDSNNSLLAAVRTVWMVVDIEKRKIESVVPFVDLFPTIAGKCFDNKSVDRIKPFTEEPMYISKQKVTYSALDIMGHSNNAKYIEWFCDGMPNNWHSEKSIKQLTVNFLHETKLNDELTLKYKWEIIEGSILLFCNVYSSEFNTFVTTFKAILE